MGAAVNTSQIANGFGHAGFDELKQAQIFAVGIMFRLDWRWNT